MSIPIKLDTYERCYPSRLKRIFRSNLNYRTYNDFVPKTKNPIIGNIPPELIRFFPKETRGEKIKAIQEAFGETAVYLRKTFLKMSREEDFEIYDNNYRPSNYLKKLAHDAKNN